MEREKEREKEKQQKTRKQRKMEQERKKQMKKKKKKEQRKETQKRKKKKKRMHQQQSPLPPPPPHSSSCSSPSSIQPPSHCCTLFSPLEQPERWPLPCAHPSHSSPSRSDWSRRYSQSRHLLPGSSSCDALPPPSPAHADETRRSSPRPRSDQCAPLAPLLVRS